MKPEEYEHFIKLLRDEIERLEHANAHLRGLVDKANPTMTGKTMSAPATTANFLVHSPANDNWSTTPVTIPRLTNSNWTKQKRDKTGRFKRKARK